MDTSNLRESGVPKHRQMCVIFPGWADLGRHMQAGELLLPLSPVARRFCCERAKTTYPPAPHPPQPKMAQKVEKVTDPFAFVKDLLAGGVAGALRLW